MVQVDYNCQMVHQHLIWWTNCHQGHSLFIIDIIYHSDISPECASSAVLYVVYIIKNVLQNIRVIILLPVNHSPQVIKQWDYVVTLFLTSLLRKSLECVFLKWLTWSHTDSNNSHVLSCFSYCFGFCFLMCSIYLAYWAEFWQSGQMFWQKRCRTVAQNIL